MAIEWLESELQDQRAAFVLISHDKRLLADLTKATVWLDRGATRRLEQGFSAFEAWRDQKLEEEEAERHKLDRKIVAEEHWMRYGVTARRKRNMRRVGELAAMRRDRREAQRAVGVATMVAQDVRTSGALVIEAEGISKAYEGRPIVKDFSLRVMRGDRLGIIGANGAGKTTLVNLLTGQLAPDEGIVRLGSQVSMATLDQRRATLAPTTTLVDALTGGGSDYVTIGAERKHVFGYMKDFLFPPEQARTPIGKLSGGERGRLMLARALALSSNVLVLDEPTNDLDIETLDLLQELLADYAGTLLLVSHDRDFLDRIVTSVLVSEGGGVGSNMPAVIPTWSPSAATACPGRPGKLRKSLKKPRRTSRSARFRSGSCRSTNSACFWFCRRGSSSFAANSPRSKRRSPTPACTNAIRRAFGARPISTPANGPSSKRPSTIGWSWRFCARRSRGPLCSEASGLAHSARRVPTRSGVVGRYISCWRAFGGTPRRSSSPLPGGSGLAHPPVARRSPPP